jgi:hypothetical protein
VKQPFAGDTPARELVAETGFDVGIEIDAEAQ